MADYHPIDAHARGKLRLWRQNTHMRHATMEHICRSKETASAARIFVKPSGHNRQRAWFTLQRAFRDVTWLEFVRRDGREPLALWTAIKPRGPVLGAIGGELSPEELQGGVTLNYLLLGQVGTGPTFAEGLWTAEVTLHALGRLLQRNSGAILDNVLLEFHRALLQAPSASLEVYINNGMVVPAGRGAFLCSGILAPDTDPFSSKLALVIRAHTWVDQDQLGMDQEKLARQLTEEPDAIPLGRNWLLPDPLRSRGLGS